MKTFAAFLLGMVTMVCFQGRTADWIVISGLAKHLDGQQHCNSTTSGIGLEVNDYAAGIYRNSNCRWSLYGAKAWLPLRYGSLRGGLIGGVVTGYETPLMPVAGFAATYEGKTYGINLILIPPVGESGNVAWLTFKRRF